MPIIIDDIKGGAVMKEWKCIHRIEWNKGVCSEVTRMKTVKE